MVNYVFLTAKDGAIHVRADDVYVGKATTVAALFTIFNTHSIAYGTEILNSSSIDFASEEGFADDGDAHKMIDAALNMMHQTRLV